MREITLIYPYYRNPLMLALQLDHWALIPAELKPFIRIILVDDGSPEERAVDAISAYCSSEIPAMSFQYLTDDVSAQFSGIPFELNRIDVDVRWNWIAARNLAVSRCQTEWFIMTDIDHLIPYETLTFMIKGKLNPLSAYKFSRVDAYVCSTDGTLQYNHVKAHPNSWLMTRAIFEKVGGYDERWSGFYGSDGEFRDRVTKVALQVVTLEYRLIRVEKHVIADSETRHYARKQPEDTAHKKKVREQIRRSPKTHRLTFPWSRVL